MVMSWFDAKYDAPQAELTAKEVSHALHETFKDGMRTEVLADGEDPAARPLVLDLGTNFTKIGRAGTAPLDSFPTVVARPNNVLFGSGDAGHRAKSGFSHQKAAQYYFGREAQENAGVCTVTCPMKQGRVHNWNDMKLIWNFCFKNVMGINEDELSHYKILVTEAPRCPKQNREAIVNTLMKDFKFGACYVASQAVLAMYTEAKVTGVSIDLGGGGTTIVPVFKGYAIANGILRMKVDGHDLTAHLIELLKYHNGMDLEDKELTFESSADKELARNIKFEHCYVAQAPKDEDDMSGAEEVELPDGSTMLVNVPLWKCPEALFNPKLIGKDAVYPGIHQMVANCIQKCQISVRTRLSEFVCLSGAGSKFKGMESRMQHEVQLLLPHAKKLTVKVVDKPELAAWRGGAILSEIASMKNMWYTQEKFAAKGARGIHAVTMRRLEMATVGCVAAPLLCGVQDLKAIQ